MTSTQICTMCHRMKAPRGRDTSPAAAGSYCTQGDCAGYDGVPHPEMLWPGEQREIADDAEALVARLAEAARTLERAAVATLLFHRGGQWTPEDAAQWRMLTGGDDASTKGLCDFARAAIAKARGEP